MAGWTWRESLQSLDAGSGLVCSLVEAIVRGAVLATLRESDADLSGIDMRGGECFSHCVRAVLFFCFFVALSLLRESPPGAPRLAVTFLLAQESNQRSALQIQPPI